MTDATDPLFPQPPQLPNLRTCGECGRSVPMDESIVLGGVAVCATCKPTVLAKLHGGQQIGNGAVWREKNVVVMGARAALPDRCVKCNAPTYGGRLKRNLYWHPQWWYLLILINLLVYAVVAVIVRKRAKIEVGLCDSHRQWRWVHIGISWAIVLGSIASIFVGLSDPQLGWLAGAGFLALLPGILWGLFGARVVYAMRIDEQFVRLGGAGRAFLESLDDLPKPA